MHAYILFSHRPGSNFQIILDVSSFHCENTLRPASEHSPDAEAALPEPPEAALLAPPVSPPPRPAQPGLTWVSIRGSWQRSKLVNTLLSSSVDFAIWLLTLCPANSRRRTFLCVERRADPGWRPCQTDCMGWLLAGPLCPCLPQAAAREPWQHALRSRRLSPVLCFLNGPVFPIQTRCHHPRISQKSHCSCPFPSFDPRSERHHSSRHRNQPPVFDFLDDSEHTDYWLWQRRWPSEASGTFGNKQYSKDVLPMWCSEW